MCIDRQPFQREDIKTEALPGVEKKKRTPKVAHGMIRRPQQQSIVRMKWLNCRYQRDKKGPSEAVFDQSAVTYGQNRCSAVQDASTSAASQHHI